MKTTINNILEKHFTYNEFESSIMQKIMMFVLSPFILLCEKYLLSEIWKKRILYNILTNDSIVSFLIKNEFGFKNNKKHILYKKDLVSSNEFFDDEDDSVVKEKITSEYMSAFNDIIYKNIAFDIEKYISLNVYILTQEIETNDGGFKSAKIYTIEIYFNRYKNYLHIRKILKKFILTISFLLISIIAFYIFKFLTI